MSYEPGMVAHGSKSQLLGGWGSSVESRVKGQPGLLSDFYDIIDLICTYSKIQCFYFTGQISVCWNMGKIEFWKQGPKCQI